MERGFWIVCCVTHFESKMIYSVLKGEIASNIVGSILSMFSTRGLILSILVGPGSYK